MFRQIFSFGGPDRTGPPFAHSQSGKIRKCCVDRLNPPPKADAGDTGGNYSFLNFFNVLNPSSASAVNETLSPGFRAKGKSLARNNERSMTRPRRAGCWSVEGDYI